MIHAKHRLQFLLFLIFSNHMNAQVPVIKEPHHKPVLVNNYVRLLDVHINAGDTTMYHIHAAPSVIVFISKSTIGMQKFGDAPSTLNEVFPAQTSFVDYGTNPITHRVFNAGKNVFHVMDIELVKKEPSPDSCAALNNAAITISEKLVRVYKFNVTSQQPFIINKSACAHLLICINGEISASEKKLKTGDYIFFDPNTEISLNIKQNKIATCVLLELK
ncbi:MAG: hypothetical protein ABJB05_12835 [Parafilimonas sp.]